MPLPLRERLTQALMPSALYYRSRIADEATWGEHELNVLDQIKQGLPATLSLANFSAALFFLPESLPPDKRGAHLRPGRLEAFRRRSRKASGRSGTTSRSR